MEAVPSGSQTPWQPLRRRGAAVPLRPLLEESRGRTITPDSKIDSTPIQAEPSELHFSGFQLGKSSVKILTTYFQTTYTKKCQLLPGLAYTLKVEFCPDEWRYFYDCVHVRFKDKENLVIPVHAYPVIDDLHIPPCVDLQAVPLGQSVCHAIPLRCSCPVDFEFQVFVIQQHEAFSVQPLTGVIPANGETRITVTFSPQQYETSQFTFQLVISQFNTKPYLCTIIGSSAPHLALSRQLEENRGAVPKELKVPPHGSKLPPRRDAKNSSTKESDKLKRDHDDANHKLPPSVDVCTPAGVAKMLIKDINKLTLKDLKQASPCGGTPGNESGKMKEALFLKKVQQTEKEEQANHLTFREQVHLGSDPITEEAQQQILKEREMDQKENMEEVCAAGETKLSSTQESLNAGQVPEETPSFQCYPTLNLDLRLRALRRFQQASRKVVIQCRINRRLASQKKLVESIKNPASVDKAEEKETRDFKIPPDKPFPSSLPIVSDVEASRNSDPVPMDSIKVTSTRMHFFGLQVTRHYKLMSIMLDDKNAPPTSTSLCPVPQELLQEEAGPHKVLKHTSEEEKELEDISRFSFQPPEALLEPFPANPLRIFNPAPGLRTYEPKPKNLEFEPDSCVCPPPRYSVPESKVGGIRTQTPDTQKFTDHKTEQEVITGVTEWKTDLVSVPSLSDQLTCDTAQRRSVDYNTEIIPSTVPPPLAALPDNLPPVAENPCEGTQLTAGMLRATLPPGKIPVSNSNLTKGTTDRKSRSKVTRRSEISTRGVKK
ncbi:cilia- and flagella-associated protein 221 isoform X4 [Nothobranchius furzeri]|uniref:cilia- and flagella-associated protein 221 isoform X4 n=1 Tax=Nothobranchius furzeri TaxID=105023 RepID=UPI003904D581